MQSEHKQYNGQASLDKSTVPSEEVYARGQATNFTTPGAGLTLSHEQFVGS